MAKKERDKKAKDRGFSNWFTAVNHHHADGVVRSAAKSGQAEQPDDGISNDAEQAISDMGTEDGFISYLQRFDFYDLLQVDSDATAELIHRNYLRRVRELLVSKEIERELEPWQIEKLIHALSLAHETLRDTSSRGSYDKSRHFRQTVSEHDRAETARKRPSSAKNVYSLISLLRYSQLVSAADLDATIAASVGKTELEIAAYLVEVGKLTIEELESITLARYLLALGKISITQYEFIAGEMKEAGVPFWVGLVAKGWVKMSDVIS
jgi:hypothetical protein